MIVEDDNLIASLMEGLLTKKDYAVVGKVTTGEEAIAMAIKHLPDLVLMDILLEGQIDGIEATKYITSLFKIPVLFVSGEKNDEIFAKAAGSSPAGYIIKPFTANDIYSNIEIAIRNAQFKRNSKDTYDLPAIAAYKSLSENDAYFLLDNYGRIIFMNPYAEHMINCEITQAAKKSINQYLVFYNIETRMPIKDTFKEVVRESNFFGKKTKIAAKLASGIFRPVVVNSLVVKDSFEQPLGTLFKVHLKAKGEV